MAQRVGGEVQEIHDRSMAILEKTGIRFLHAPALEILKKHGVRVEGDVAFFSEKRVMEKVALAPETFPLRARNGKYDVRMGGDAVEPAPPFGAPFVQDSKGRNRSATLKDFVLLTKFFHQQEEFRINGGILCQPNDQNPQTAAILMLYALILGTDKCLICPSGTASEVVAMLEMLRILFDGEEGLRRAAGTVYLVDSISPLQIDGRTLDAIVRLAEYGQALSFSSGVIAGMTGPVTIPGAVALGNAEILAGIAFSQMVREGTPVIYGIPFLGSEMKRGGATFGGPEMVLGIRYAAGMARHYRLPSRGAGSLTDAPICGMQSAYESLMTLQAGYEEGVHCLANAAGVLDSFKTVSLEKCLADMEQIRRLAYLKRYRVLDDGQFAMELIDEVGYGGDFLARDHTLKYFRESLFNPDVSVRGIRKERYGDALGEGMEKRLRKNLSKYVRPDLPGDVVRALGEAAMRSGIPESVLQEINAMLEQEQFSF